MAAVEMFEDEGLHTAGGRQQLRLVKFESAPPIGRNARPLAQRRAARALMLKRRRRAIVVLVLLAGLTILALPGVAFGGVGGGGLSSDLNNNASLSAGMVFVVQPGDTVSSIARMINPGNPARARSALVRELGSRVVVPGEHVLIP
ncbi:MAG: hypothetical protein ABSE75_12265 [Acidimicrobiales bacterium]